jgi:hypothetical protein
MADESIQSFLNSAASDAGSTSQVKGKKKDGDSH